MSAPYLLGIDVGGSRTRALVADLSGQALGYGEAGAGNHEVVGYEGLAAAMRRALAAALESAGMAAPATRCRDVGDSAVGEGFAFAGAGFGVGGFDWESERADTLAAIGTLGLSCPLELRNDAALGLAAGASGGWGVAVSAGTSNNCYGLSRDGREGRLSGAGAGVGEYGGALEIAARALAAVNHARIRRIPPTALTALLCGLSGRADADSLIEAASLGLVVPDPAWAPGIFAAALAGDGAARDIIAWAGRELGESAAAVIRQLGLEGERFELVLSGSLFGLEPALGEAVAGLLSAFAPGARIVRLEAPPVTGALLLGAQAAGLAPGSPERAPLRDRLLGSTRELLERK